MLHVVIRWFSYSRTGVAHVFPAPFSERLFFPLVFPMNACAWPIYSYDKRAGLRCPSLFICSVGRSRDIKLSIFRTHHANWRLQKHINENNEKIRVYMDFLSKFSFYIVSYILVYTLNDLLHLRL